MMPIETPTGLPVCLSFYWELNPEPHTHQVHAVLLNYFLDLCLFIFQQLLKDLPLQEACLVSLKWTSQMTPGYFLATNSSLEITCKILSGAGPLLGPNVNQVDWAESG